MIEATSAANKEALSPFFSIKPVTKSLHPHYNLRTEMDTKEQDKAMEVFNFQENYEQTWEIDCAKGQDP